MFSKLILLVVAVSGLSEALQPHPYFLGNPRYVVDVANILQETPEDMLTEIQYEPHWRSRRQVQMSGNENPDKSRNYDLKIGLAGDQDSAAALSALGSVNGLKSDGRYNAAGAGLLLESNRNALGIEGKDIPSFGQQLTGSAKVNLFHNDNHNLDGNAFITKNMPRTDMLPNFYSTGGNLDYNYKDKVGATLSAAHTPLFQQTDYSALGKVNLFKDRTSSFDFGAGASRSFSPYIPHSSWEPKFMFSYKKTF